MSDRDDDNNQEQDGDQAGNNWSRNDNLFNDFEDESEFEDSDRDSDFATIYTEVDEEEPEAEEPEPLEPPVDDATWELEEEFSADTEQGDYNDPWEESETEAYEPVEPDLWDTEPNPPGAFDDEPPEAVNDLPPIVAPTTAEHHNLEEEWEEMEEDEGYEEDESREMTISLSMIIVAVFALVLLGAGGYGVIEQRATMQEEIRQLQAKLATSAPPKEVAAGRVAVAEASERSNLLEAQLQELSRENSSLQAIVAGLEKQLAAQQAALSKPQPAPKPVTKPAPTPEPATTKAPASSAPATGWFVNFSSYSKQSTAESWVSKLQPSSGRVIVATGQSNGRTIYRVRVVDLEDRDTAEAIARTLEKEHGLPRLWVGKSD